MTSTRLFSGARRPGSPLSAPEPGPVRIGTLGADADGVATLADGGPLFLFGTLPGELVQPGLLAKRGPAWASDGAILEASPDRVMPPCPHFGSCGGCSIQHLADAPYAAWKSGLLLDAVRRLGFSGEMPPLARTPPDARRRIDLAIRRERGGAVVIGLRARRSTEIVNMTACPVLHPTLFQLVQSLRPVLRGMDGFRREGSALVNLLDSGADLLLRTDAPLSAADRTRLTALAESLRLPRISWARGSRDEPEPACMLRPATTSFSGRPTPIPPGAFLQASAEGEQAILAAVIGAVHAALPSPVSKTRLFELFAGCGTLSHGLAERVRVTAFEGDAAALAALRAAKNPRVIPIQRDLARQPLQTAELKAAAAIVLDPPYPGALAQMPALAASGVPIIYVTCNPGALLRDGRVLTAAGYKVISAVAIDQFLWSARVEGVVTFARPATHQHS